MNFSDVRLIAADMDGTLLNTAHQLNERFYDVFTKLHERGIVFCAASGRQYYNILRQFKQFQDQIIYIAENGSYVVHNNEELLVQGMDREITFHLISLCRKITDVNVILCGRKSAYIENTQRDFVEKLNLYYDKVTVVNNLLEVDNDDFLKIAVCDLKGSEHNSYKHFREFEKTLQVKISGNIWLDLSHKLANKGSALRFVQQRLGINSSHTMAFGDFLNDVEMLQEASYSFAMANAHDAVKNVARYQTKSNDEDGVLSVIDTLLMHPAAKPAVR